MRTSSKYGPIGAGYHEGATYYELEDFVRQARLLASGNGGAGPTVNVDDGLMAVALGEAAHRHGFDMAIARFLDCMCLAL